MRVYAFGESRQNRDCSPASNAILKEEGGRRKAEVAENL
jgi:hypothetical protein